MDHAAQKPCHVSECMSIGSLTSTAHGADHIENASYNNLFAVACAYYGRCLEMGLHVSYIFCIAYYSMVATSCPRLSIRLTAVTDEPLNMRNLILKQVVRICRDFMSDAV
jgi:hypothetical protein